MDGSQGRLLEKYVFKLKVNINSAGLASSGVFLLKQAQYIVAQTE